MIEVKPSRFILHPKRESGGLRRERDEAALYGGPLQCDPLMPRLIDLSYESRQRPSRAPFDWRRALWLTVALCAPPIACYAWAWLSTAWLVRQPWWHSGQPWEDIYRPKFIKRPWTVCTVVLALECVFIVGIGVRRRWETYWLAALPGAFVIWMIFDVVMFVLNDDVFP